VFETENKIKMPKPITSNNTLLGMAHRLYSILLWNHT